MNNETKELKQVLKIDKEGIHIIDDSVSYALSKKNLSASMMTGLEGCPARWIAENYATPDIVVLGPESPARRGSLFHKIMEKFFNNPQNQRTRHDLKKIMFETLKMPEFEDMRENKETMDWLKNVINNYYKMGAKPEQIKIANIEIDGRERKGLEIFIKGKIGDTNRNILGVIDRVIESKKGNGVIIEDYKTSATAKKWKNHTKSTDGFSEQRQQLIYTKLMEDNGVNVSGARLIYPVAKEIVRVQLDNPVLKKKAFNSIIETDRNLTTMEENNTFEFNPSFLCAWCPIRKICLDPGPLNHNSVKIMNAYESQPEPEILEQVIEI